jgi:hypothetical protein
LGRKRFHDFLVPQGVALGWVNEWAFGPEEQAHRNNEMNPRVVSVRPLENYIVELTFSDGFCGTVDLSKWIVGHGGVFAPLHDETYFRRVEVDREAKTIVWPNGVDFCPDVLYEAAVGSSVPQETR